MTPQQEADAWNAKHPVGTKVLLRKDTREMVTTTRSPASTLNENIAVIWLEGVSGCYALSRVSPVE